MRPVFAFALVAIACRAAPPATTRHDDPAQVQARLFALEDTWTKGLIARDTSLFSTLLDARFVYTENDKLYTRDDVVSSVVGSDTVTDAHNEDMVAHLYGDDLGVVTGWLVVNGRSAGKTFARRYRFTDTWALRDGAWKIVAAEDYLAP